MQGEQRLNKNQQSSDDKHEPISSVHQEHTGQFLNSQSRAKYDANLIQVDSGNQGSDGDGGKFHLFQPVWAKIKGYPWWPAKIISIINPNNANTGQTNNQHSKQANTNNNKLETNIKYAVMFAGDSSIALLTQSSLIPYVLDGKCPCDYSKMKSNWKKDKHTFDEQIRLAQSAMKQQKQTKKLSKSHQSIKDNVQSKSLIKTNIILTPKPVQQQDVNICKEKAELYNKYRLELTNNNNDTQLAHEGDQGQIQQMKDITSEYNGMTKIIQEHQQTQQKQTKHKPISKESKAVLAFSYRNNSTRRYIMRRKQGKLTNNKSKQQHVRIVSDENENENESKMVPGDYKNNEMTNESKGKDIDNYSYKQNDKAEAKRVDQGGCHNDNEGVEQSKQCWSPHQQTVIPQ